MRFKHALVGSIVAIVAAAAIAQLKDSSRGSGTATYQVTPWPDHREATTSYADEIEEYLNRKAAEGWRFHSELAGQGAKMMLFEKAGK